MKRLPLLLLPLLAACAPPSPQGPVQGGLFTSVFQGPEAEPPAPEPLPPRVVQALPPGVPESVVQRGADGCYLLAIEVTTPPSGYPLRDSSGTPICEPGAVPLAAPAPGLVGTLPPAPGLVGTLPPAPGLIGTAPLASGSITPPAPIAPLNPG